MTEMAPEMELIILDDLEPTIECEWKFEDDYCGVEATWLLIKMCGCDIPFCDMHKSAVDVEIRKVTPHYIRCTGCKLVDSRLGTPSAFRWEPIR